ncbi:MAG: sigma-70 family RNA polymerase sigma factor, partial [Prosthecobacter sp.]
GCGCWSLRGREDGKMMRGKMMEDTSMNAEKILADNEGLVQHVVRRMVLERDVEDAAQEGRLGLLYAAERFEDGRGAKFSTYACWCIQSRVLRWKDYQRDVVRVPVERKREGVRVFVDGLDAPMATGRGGDDGKAFCLADVLAAPAEDSADCVERERLWAAVEGLKEPMRSVIQRRFSRDEPTREQINEELGLGVSRERIRQLENEGLRILRKRLKGLGGG